MTPQYAYGDPFYPVCEKKQTAGNRSCVRGGSVRPSHINPGDLPLAEDKDVNNRIL